MKTYKIHLIRHGMTDANDKHLYIGGRTDLPLSPEGFADLLKLYGVQHVVYGHLHGAGLAGAIVGDVDGVCYHQVSCDGLGFKLAQIIE